MASSVHEILGQKLFDGKTKTIYSMIDQPGLVCIFRKDFYHQNGPTLTIPGSRRSSLDSTMRFQSQSNSPNQNGIGVEIVGKGALVTSITTCVYEILREASIPTFYVAPHPQPAMFIARKCTMIPILWIVRRLANDNYVRRNPSVRNGHRFVPAIVEIYHKRHPLTYRRFSLNNIDEKLESSRESLVEDDDSDTDECLSSIWSYDQLLNAQFDIENLKITGTEIEYMYETATAIFDILEHLWMVKKQCQLIDLKLEFGITTTTTKEIVLANAFDIETWHILRSMDKCSSPSTDSIRENLVWINNALRDILDLNINIPLNSKSSSRRKSFGQHRQEIAIDESDRQTQITADIEQSELHKDSLPLNTYSSSFSPSTTSRCVIVCSSRVDIDNGQKIKVTLIDNYNIACELRLCSISRSIQTISKFLSNYAHEHCRPTVFVTLGNMNNGLAMCLAANTSYPVIHCSSTQIDQQPCLIDTSTFLTSDSSLFSVVFTIPSAVQNVIQLLAMHDWKLWTRQRGKRLKHYLDVLVTDQQLMNNQLKQQTNPTNSGILMSK